MNISPVNNGNEFDDLFEAGDEDKQLEQSARALSFRFLSEIEKNSDQSKGLKKRLAQLIGTSASYITQLFNGEKLLNLETAAKFEKALKIKFKITAYPETIFYKACQSDPLQINIFTNNTFVAVGTNTNKPATTTADDYQPSTSAFSFPSANVQVMQKPIAPDLS